MMRVMNTLFMRATQPKILLTPQLNLKPVYNFASFVDKMQKKQAQKSQEQIRKEIEHLANKPSFTLMDYKQRILDELSKINNSIRAKMSSQTQEQEKELQVERKVMSCLYEDELNERIPLKLSQKKAISLVSQVDYDKVCDIFKKAERYQRMHRMLRDMKQRGEPIPKDMQELNYMYMRSGLEMEGPKQKYMKYQKQSRIQRNRYIKWGIQE